MTHQTMKQRSALVRASERGLDPQPNRGDYILALVGVVGCVVILILSVLGVI